MVTWAKSRWLSYFYSGACAFILSWVMAMVLSGCHFGNYEQDATNPDAISGFYETAPASLSFYTRTFAGVESTTAVTDLTLIPEFLGTIATNPVQLSVSDLATGQAQISSPYGSSQYALPVVAEAGTLTPPPGNSVTAVQTTTCALNVTIVAQGSYTHAGPFTSGVAVPLKGRILMTANIQWALTGSDCSFIATCYFDATKCEQTGTSASNTFDLNNQAQQWVKTAIDPEIKAGIVTTTNFMNYSDFHYTVAYQ